MNRTIKFRGKSLHTGEWAYGFYCRHDYGAQYCDKKLIKEACSVHDIWTKSGWISVEESTIGQYTGLDDLNGKEIFEGDIVRFYDDIEDEFSNGEVKYSPDYCSFVVVSPLLAPFGLSKHWQFEVIGNIHDNPKQIHAS